MSQHVLILGGHGKIAQLLTSILLKKSWRVTSIIRKQEQIQAIQQLAPASNDSLNVLVRSLEDIKDVPAAKAILDEVKPDAVVWSAGAGGKGPKERTYQVDRDASINFMRAAVQTPSIKKYILLSWLASRSKQPNWWNASHWEDALRMREDLPDYSKAKTEADRVQLKEMALRDDMVSICLRPGLLSDDPAGGVELGKTRTAKGNISRASVAAVAASLLENDQVRSCWLDLLDGQEAVGDAVDRVARDRVNAAEGG